MREFASHIPKISAYRSKLLKNKVHRFFMGSKETHGVLFSTAVYVLLIVIGFVYVYPLLYMFVTSIKPLRDLLNESVKWIPTAVYFDNYEQAIKVLDFSHSLLNTILLTGVSSILQVAIASLTGYGFARYHFRGKGILFAVLIIAFILPQQATLVPTYLLFKDLGIIGTIKAFVYPAALGQGLKSTVIVLIFYQFYKQIPLSLVEAAQLDGCGQIRIFWSIALPSVSAAFLIGFLFSFVWYWNETYLTSLFISNTGLGNQHSVSTLLIKLQAFEESYKNMNQADSGSVNRINESIRMAGTMLCITPLLVLYAFLQRYFVESIDRVGLKD